MVKLRNLFKHSIPDDKFNQIVEDAKTGSEAVKGLFELGKGIQDLETLKPYLDSLSPLFDALNSPFGALAGLVIPHAYLPIYLLKIIVQVTKKEPTLLELVTLVSQAAYLQSLQDILKKDEPLLQQSGESPISKSVESRIQKLGDLEFDEGDAKAAVECFHLSKLAQAVNEVVIQRLQEEGLDENRAKMLTEKVARQTDKLLTSALAQAKGEAAEYLLKWFQFGGLIEQKKDLIIENYLDNHIKPNPEKFIFDETEITFRDLYVSLNVRLLDSEGKPIKEKDPMPLEKWVDMMLWNSASKDKQVLFIQGEAGRGKSVFCRMFAESVRQDCHPAFTPILIRLRKLRALAGSLPETLKNYLQNLGFVMSDADWLRDPKTRFLFLLDGFDELLLQRRESDEIKNFLEQVLDFQEGSHHRFLITGRPLALQGVEDELYQKQQLERVAILPMDNEIRETWLEKWANKVGTQEADNFQEFLEACPTEINDNLAREPLLLYLLGRMHREQALNAAMFVGTSDEITAKIRIYDEAVNWVLKKQRQDQNKRLTGRKPEDLRRSLAEAALCVVQSGNECARVAMLKARLKDSQNKETKLEDLKDLNKLLTAFYIKPASGDPEGSVEFTHKSFGEFLFAERLIKSCIDWTLTTSRYEGDCINPDPRDKEVYDLLGYGPLTPEIVQYLRGLWENNPDFKPIPLFERLQKFYLRWCEGEFIDAKPETLPQFKMLLLQEQLGEVKTQLGQRQVDLYTGLNVMILLLELHRYAQTQDELKDKICFYPCGEPNTDQFYPERLLQIIGYSHCLSIFAFRIIIGFYLSGANLSGANLSDTNLSGINLSSVNLSNADLSDANLGDANLSDANLSNADLSNADLSHANLSNADLSNAGLWRSSLIIADLSNADLSGADLSDAHLSDANLSDAHLSDADLSGADLSNADLINANLSGADLINANLSGADLSGANLSGANLNRANLTKSIWDTATTWVNAIGLDEAVGASPELEQQPRFLAARVLSQGYSWVREGKVKEAIEAYQQAQEIDPNLQVSAKFWSLLCWYGCLYGKATDALDAGEKAVSLEPDNIDYQESRGLAKALSGDIDGALTDFQAVLESSSLPSYSSRFNHLYLAIRKPQWHRWVEALKTDENPFTPEELEALRKVPK
ncbi:pentapeptide repeat-containing protein [Laspinema olomoucense]|uniref:pentapeptide repeat-containing protein n=1 Tax=Laspinema olomoucense TaxID=3231600 RepID=UPI0021BB2D9B|nr:pentapeptide repeat-containing protein [Laspinema sp. D3c]MCT7992672.1 pentapeptide repeat-containing protein [Laspinema sp. D3c]